MSNEIRKRFVIYSAFGEANASMELPKLGRVVCENVEANTIQATFYGTSNGGPTIICELQINPKVAKELDILLLSQIQGILHYGIDICISYGILPLSEDKYFMFYRHGNDIFRWIREIRS